MVDGVDVVAPPGRDEEVLSVVLPVGDEVKGEVVLLAHRVKTKAEQTANIADIFIPLANKNVFQWYLASRHLITRHFATRQQLNPLFHFPHRGRRYLLISKN